MRLEGENILCRVLVTNFLQVRHRPAYEAVVETAWRMRMAGATVMRGIAGYVLAGPVLALHPWWPANQLPVVVELVDAAERVSRLVAQLDRLVANGIVTLEPVHVAYHRASDVPQDRGRVPICVDTDPADEHLEVVALTRNGEGMRARIYVDDTDRDPVSGGLLYDRLVHLANEMGLAGATAFRGTMGFGMHSVIHAARLADASPNMPVVVEVVDEEAKVKAFLAAVNPRVVEGLVIQEKVSMTWFARPS